MKRYVCFTLMALSCAAHGEYEFDFGCKDMFKSVTVTPTNAMVKFNGPGWMVTPDSDVVIWGSAIRHSRDYAENDEALILTPDKRTDVFERHGSYSFNPVVYKDGLNGFRIMRIDEMRSFGRGVTSNSWYFALNDTPVEVGEDDVEMIMVKGREWKTFERGTKEPLPAPEPVQPPSAEPPPEPPAVTPTEPAPVTAMQDGPPAAIAEDAPSGEESKANYLWLYIAIALGLLAALYFLRKKRK